MIIDQLILKLDSIIKDPVSLQLSALPFKNFCYSSQAYPCIATQGLPYLQFGYPHTLLFKVR